MPFPNVTDSYPRYMIATNALITKANGLAMLVALPLFGAGEEADVEAPVLVPEVPAALVLLVTVVATDVVNVAVLVKVAELNVVLREMELRPVPRTPVPTVAVVTLLETTVVTTRRPLLLLLDVLTAERSDETNDERDAEAAEVMDAAEADVLEADTADDADTDVADDAFSLTDETTPDPPEKENCPE